jgi:heme A synthase
MFSYDTIRSQWAIAGLLGGLAAVAAMLLWYWALWRPRGHEEGEATERQPGFIVWWTSFCPWVLTLTIVFGTFVGISYAVYRMFYPPNW